MTVANQLVEQFKKKSIRCIIFDFDGTLLDVKKALKDAVIEVFDYYKIIADIDHTIQEIGTVLESIQGHPIPKILLQSYDLFKNISSLQKFSFLKKLRIAVKLFTRYLDYSKEEATIFPGTKELLEHLSKQHDLYIVSHNQTKSILDHLEKEGLTKYFKGIFGADKLIEMKPSIKAFQPIFELHDSFKAREFVMIGDMPSDIEAGQEAGFWTIALTSGVSNEAVLAQYNPDIIIHSLEELLELINNKKIK